MQKRIMVTYMIIILLALFLSGIFSSKAIENHYIQLLRNNLVAQNLLINNILRDEEISLPNTYNLNEIANKISRKVNARVTIITTEGLVVGDSEEDYKKMDNHKNRPEVAAALKGEISSTTRFSETVKTRMMYVAMPIKQNGRIAGVIRLSIALQDVIRMVRNIWKINILAAFISTIIVFFVGIKISRDITKPLRKMSVMASEIARGNLGKKITIKTRDEVRELADAFNYMTEKLKETINELEDGKGKMKAILTNMFDGIIAIDRKRRIILTNPSVEKILGIEQKNTMGRHLMEVVRNHELMDFFNEVFKKESPVFKEMKVIYPGERFLRLHFSPIRMEDGRIIGAVAVIRDITQLRKLERVRKDFVANVTHELRTPLTSITGFVETLLDGYYKDPEVTKKFLEIIDFESKRLHNLINDILDLSRIETGKVEFKAEKVNLKGVCQETLKIFNKRIKEKQMDITVNIPENLSQVLGDKRWLEHVLMNLIDNAIKYTPPGGKIEIFAKEKKYFVEVAVRDTGIGIPKEHIDRIFERFYRVDKARSREEGGTGLGLSIVKHIVENMGGEIWVESERGKGSTFIFTLPKVR